MDFAPDIVRGQVARVLGSKIFETSDVHRQVLTYLAEKTLSGEADRLKEYTVGLEAFGKPSSYDPRQDSIVRLQVGRVRQKLLAYYQTEATREELVVTLPKGGFKLNFEAPPRNGSARLPHSRLAPVLALALAVVSLWAGVASFAWLRSRRTAAAVTPWTPELQALWAPFVDSNRSLLVCLGAPLFVRFPNYGFFRDPKTNEWEEIEKSGRVQAFRKAIGGGDMLASYSFTGAGEAGAAFLLAKHLAARRPDLLLTRSNLLSWQQIADQNIVFVGPPKFNQQLQAAVMHQDIVVEPEGLRNLKPRPGEPVYLQDHFVPGKVSEGETHALISRMRGISGNGEFLVLAGNGSPDTLAAAEWLTQPWRARELVARLRGPTGELPATFQVVLKVAFRQGIPVQSSYVFHHAWPAAKR